MLIFQSISFEENKVENNVISLVEIYHVTAVQPSLCRYIKVNFKTFTLALPRIPNEGKVKVARYS